MPTAKNRFHILNLHPINMYLNKKYPFLNANLLEKLPITKVLKIILMNGYIKKSNFVQLK